MFRVNKKDSRPMTLFCSMVDIDPLHGFQAKIYLLKDNNRDTRITCEMCKVDNKENRTSSMTSFWCPYVNFKHIPHLVLLFLLRTLSMYWFALCDLFYILIVFRFDGFKFHPFLEKDFHEAEHFHEVQCTRG